MIRPWLRIKGGEYNGRWIIDRLTKKVTIPSAPVTTKPEPPPPKKGFAVQVISSTLEREATAAVSKLQSLGYSNAYLVSSNVRFMARVGPFPSRAEALMARDRLISQGFRNDSFIVEE